MTYDENLFVDREKKLGGFQKLLKPETPQAVMLIRAREKMGKSWLVSKMRVFCAQPDATIPLVLLDFRHPRETFQLQTCLGLVRLTRDKLNAPDYFRDLNAIINKVTAAPAGRPVAEYKLLTDRMSAHLNEVQLRELARTLNVDPENLPHAIKSELAFGLARSLDQANRLPELLAALAQKLPLLHLDWGEGINLTAPPFPVAEAGEDRNQPLVITDELARKEAERQINEAFFRALAALMADRRLIVFLLDSYEEATEEAKQWVANELLLRLRDGQINDVVVIVTGREIPDLDTLGMDQLVVKTELEPFDDQYVKQYLEKRKIPPDSGLDVHTVVLTSGGIPGVLALMVDNVLAKVQKDDPFFSDV